MTKIIKLFLILFLTTIQVSKSQSIKSDLSVADSLFQEKKFTESFQIYSAIYETGEMISPRMLLKMAFIKDGLGDYSNALYYLNLYYLKTSNKRALKKMEELANANGLEGFQYSDSDFFLNLYFKNYNQIVLTVSLLCFVVFTIILYQKFKKQKKPVLVGILFLLMLGATWVVINFGHPMDKGMIAHSNSYIMTGPSAGSEVLEIVKKGHKVSILDTQDVWAKIKWDGKTGYIKHQHLKPIHL